MKTLPMKAWLAAGLAGIMSIGVMATPALAHHSFAMYDQTKTKTHRSYDQKLWTVTRQ